MATTRKIPAKVTAPEPTALDQQVAASVQAIIPYASMHVTRGSVRVLEPVANPHQRAVAAAGLPSPDTMGRWGLSDQWSQLIGGWLQAERHRAAARLSPVEAYFDYHSQLRPVIIHRRLNGEFDRLLFQDLIRTAVTPGKPIVERSPAMTDEEYEAVSGQLEAPFNWYHQHVNEGLTGKRGGACEVGEWAVEHALEGGLVGFACTFETRRIAGVNWRVPVEFQVYGGMHLVCDQPKSEFADERWYVKLHQDFNFAMQPSYEDTNRFCQLRSAPEANFYADVHKLNWASGSGSIYPMPPYFALLDDLLIPEMIKRDNLATLATNARIFRLWTFDTAMMDQLGLAWDDDVDENGEPITGEVSRFQRERQRILEAGPSDDVEMVVLNVVSCTTIQSSIDVLEKSLAMFQPYHEALQLVSGLLWTPEGRPLEAATALKQAGDAQWIRSSVVQPLNQKVYDWIIAENRRWFGSINGLGGRYSYDPFAWQSGKLAKRGRALVSRDERLGVPVQEMLEKRVADELKLRLAGHDMLLGVTHELLPTAVHDVEFVAQVRGACESGGLPWASYHEVIGADHAAVERTMRRQVERETYIDPASGEVRPLWAAPATFSQTVERPGRGADAENRGSTTHDSQLSKGRPAGQPTNPDLEDGYGGALGPR
jgi:hypothetical protein